jgi:hypothetical protein
MALTAGELPANPQTWSIHQSMPWSPCHLIYSIFDVNYMVVVGMYGVSQWEKLKE